MGQEYFLTYLVLPIERPISSKQRSTNPFIAIERHSEFTGPHLISASNGCQLAVLTGFAEEK
jgi:hypothetical protein